MDDIITIRGEGISVDLLLWRKFGVRGRELVERVFDINPGLAAFGPIIPMGTKVIIPPLPAESRKEFPMPVKSKRATAAIAGAVGAIALSIGALIKPWEGRELKAYRDIVGVWTICDGETTGVKPGMVKTNAECDAMLITRVENDFYKPLTRCIKGYEAAPVSWQASMLSLSYNVGTGAACGSTAAKLARSGKLVDLTAIYVRANVHTPHIFSDGVDITTNRPL